MTLTEFEDSVIKLEMDANQILYSKMADYSDGDDTFSNFKQLAEECNISHFKVWFVYFMKHIQALRSYILGGNLESEPIEERIKDAMNYLKIFNGMVIEHNKDVEASEW